MRVRRLLLGATGLGLVACLVALALRWVATAAVPVVVLQSAFPLVGCAALALLVLAVVLRGWRVALGGAVVVAAVAATGLPAVQRHTVPPADDDLVVLSANLQLGGADPAALVREAKALDADVVVLVEVTPEALARLDAAGLSAWPSRSGLALPGAAGIVVRSREHLDPIDWGPGQPSPWAGATGRLSTSRGPVVVRGAHPNAPNLHDATHWRAAMTEYTRWTQGRHQDEAVIVAGDLNSGWGHPAFRSLAQGWTDAHRAAGKGWVRTWPLGSRVPPFTQLDHVLVRGLDVVDAGQVTLPGTDHAAVWARLHRR